MNSLIRSVLMEEDVGTLEDIKAARYDPSD